VLLIFRKLLERLTEKQLMAIDANKAMDVKNCSITHYAFDPTVGKNGKLVLRAFNKVYYPENVPQWIPLSACRLTRIGGTGGAVASKAEKAAARKNGKLGGCPRNANQQVRRALNWNVELHFGARIRFSQSDRDEQPCGSVSIFGVIANVLQHNSHSLFSGWQEFRRFCFVHTAHCFPS
jgi:hypothetical protein